MSLLNKLHLSDFRSVMRLAVEATVGVTDVVENIHQTILQRRAPLGQIRADRTRGLTGVVYRSIRGTTQFAGKGLDAVIAPLSTFLPESGSPARRNNVVSAINGVYGDYLAETHNPLAIQMGLRHDGQHINLDQADTSLTFAQGTAPKARLMLFVHGLCLNETHWTRNGRNQGEQLALALGFTPIYLRYNTGLKISENGQDLTSMLESLLDVWPVTVRELVIIGHSMGGLVARSACHQGGQAGHAWMDCLTRLAFIGSPHQGAPLEQGSSWLFKALELSPYSAPFTRIANKRSAGINDLQYGRVSASNDQVIALPDGVECYAMAASLAKKQGWVHQKLIGDGLVPVDSALGRSRNPSRNLGIPESHQWLGLETGHIPMLGCNELFKQLHEWFA